MNNNRMTLFDGTKSIDLPQYPDEAWTWLSGKPDGDAPGLQSYYKAIPFLFRGVDMRANRVSSMPFGIFRGETEIDNSADYQNAVGFLPNPKRLFALIEMSLVLLGKAYLFNVRNARVTLDLKYLNPTSIKEQIEDPEGLVGFKRTTTTGTKDLEVEDIIYFWPGDPWVELGPPTASPGSAALMASGVLANVDEFVAAYFKRGAIKAMLFTAKGMAAADRKKFLARWDSIVTGVRNAFKTIILNTEDMKPVVVGEGIEGLQDQDLNNEKQKDIATALGVPQSMLFSNAANRATAEVDLFNFYDITITPEVEFIFSILNEHVLNPMGFDIRDKHESLDVYQADETNRSISYLHYIQAKMPPSIAAEMLGLELPADVEYEQLDEFARELRDASAERFQPGLQSEPTEEVQAARSKSVELDSKCSPNDNLVCSMDCSEYSTCYPLTVIEDSAEVKADLAKWERKALRLLEKEGSAACEFESQHISPERQEAIRANLGSVVVPEDLKSVFRAGMVNNVSDDDRSLQLLEGLGSAVRVLRESAWSQTAAST
jgi:HK97 family phage portal protein